jgi:hypothetical protein
VIVVKAWTGPYAAPMTRWLSSKYEATVLGRWPIYITRTVRERAAREGIVLQPRRSPGSATRG